MDEITLLAYESKEANVTASAQNISAFAFTADYLTKAEELLVTAKGTDVMFYVDGSTPTASNGHVIPVNSSFVIKGRANVGQFRFIARSGSGTIAATIFGSKKK